jgi:hypothetical protein
MLIPVVSCIDFDGKYELLLLLQPPLFIVAAELLISCCVLCMCLANPNHTRPSPFEEPRHGN